MLWPTSLSLVRLFPHLPASLPILWLFAWVWAQQYCTAPRDEGANLLLPKPQWAQEEEEEKEERGSAGRRAEQGSQPQLAAITIWPNPVNPPATTRFWWAGDSKLQGLHRKLHFPEWCSSPLPLLTLLAYFFKSREANYHFCLELYNTTKAFTFHTEKHLTE